jgi:hypothetical protein
MTICLRAMALALLAGTGTAALGQSSSVGAAPASAASTHDPALGGRGEPAAGRDAATAFSPGDDAGGPRYQGRTAGALARWQSTDILGEKLRTLNAEGVGSYAGISHSRSSCPIACDDPSLPGSISFATPPSCFLAPGCMVTGDQRPAHG